MDGKMKPEASSKTVRLDVEANSDSEENVQFLFRGDKDTQRSVTDFGSNCVCPSEEESSILGWNKTGKEQRNLSYLILECLKVGNGRKLVLNSKTLLAWIGRRLSERDIVLVCDYLQANPTVIEADLSGNNLLDENLKPLARFLKSNRSLETLDLSCNDLGHTWLRLLATRDSPKQGFYLKKLVLNANKLGDAGGEAIGDLIRWARLESVYLGQTDLSLKGVASLTCAVPFSSLKTLDLSRFLGQFLYQPLTDHFAQLVSSILLRGKDLEKLILERCSLTDGDVKVLLVNGCHLKELSLRANRIADEGVSTLASLFRSSPLRVINLASNSISDTGAQALGLNLPHSKIAVLNLAFNRVSDDGVAYLLGSLRKEPKLEELHIWGNPFSMTSAKILEGALTANDLVWCDLVFYKVNGVLNWGRNVPQSSNRTLKIKRYQDRKKESLIYYIPSPRRRCQQ